MREQQAGQDERSGEAADNHLHFHTPIPSRELQKSYRQLQALLRC